MCCCQPPKVFHGSRQAPKLRAMSGSTSTGEETAQQQLPTITPWGFKTKEEMQDISSIIENIGEEHASVCVRVVCMYACVYACSCVCMYVRS
jgi:hypothetical protein